MAKPVNYPRLNIYVDDEHVRDAVKVAALRKGTSVSAYCLEAIRQRLDDDGVLAKGKTSDKHNAAAQALDRLRIKIGPIGVPVADLIKEGRRR